MADKKAAVRKARIEARGKKVELSLERKKALAVGCCAAFLLLLSLSHCTYSLHVCGIPWVFAFCMAIGIDVGMVLCECVSITGKRDEARRWADVYVKASIGLSVFLNAYASAVHAERWWFVAMLVGGCIPCFVYILAKVAAHCWKEV